jgi:hypothetical protein
MKVGIREFRANMKKYMDMASRERVYIDRRGVEYILMGSVQCGVDVDTGVHKDVVTKEVATESVVTKLKEDLGLKAASECEEPNKEKCDECHTNQEIYDRRSTMVGRQVLTKKVCKDCFERLTYE